MYDFKGSSAIPEYGAENEGRPGSVPFPVVGIGASAGGLEAFTQLLNALPTDTGMAFVVIQHLDPSHESQLTDILARTTKMTVQEATDDTVIQINSIYVIPPNASLTIAGGALHLTPRPLEGGVHLPIDRFFESLAEEQGRSAVGVILSGNGSDGSQGLKAIKGQCGLTFVQDEASAKFGWMPRNAIASGAADFVLPPAEIAQGLARISVHPYVVSSSRETTREVLPDGDGELRRIFTLVQRATGVDFSHYKQTTTKRRIGRRMIVHAAATLAEYLAYVQAHPEELHELYKDLLICVTHFFRDPAAFDALAKRLADVIRARQPEDSFRVWVPGCATGEEIYSIAICLEEILLQEGIRPALQLFGTDINDVALARARVGRYPESIADDVSPERLAQYFTRVDGHYQISKSIRDCCIFAKQDVTRDPPFSRVDVISCRNMLIYLEPALQKPVMHIFHYSLNEAGLLFLGPAETVGAAANLFHVVDGTHRIFAREAVPTHLAASFPLHRNPVEPLPARGLPRPPVVGWQKQIAQIIQNRYAPDGVVVNQDLQIVQLLGRTGFYLEPAPGEAKQNLFLMVREQLQLPLRKLVSSAMTQNSAAHHHGLRLEHQGEEREIDLEVIPLSPAFASERYYFVVFGRTTPSARAHAGNAGVSAPPELENFEQENTRLKQELAFIQEYLRSITEEHEAALEEQRASNEEISSANEELQSTNEELETAKEELQSANEELTTVNEELQNRNNELGILSNDLNNLFAAVNTPILMVDRGLLLRRFTPAAERTLGLGSGDLGRSLADLPAKTKMPRFEHVARKVIDTLAVETHEMQDDQGCWWSLSIRPYRTADHRIEGAVLTFADVDSLKSSLQEAQQARDYAESIIETIREPLVVLSPAFQVESANTAFYRTFLTTKENSIGQLLYQMEDGQWDIPQLRRLLEDVLPNSSVFEDFEVEHDFPRIGSRSMSLNARRILHPDQSTQKILLAMEDVTEHRLAERRLLRSHADLTRFGYVVAHDLQEPIRIVGTYTQLLARRLEGKLDSETGEFMQFINDGVARIQTMIQDLLTYSQAGNAEQGPSETVRAAAALDEALWSLQIAVKESAALVTHGDLPTVSYPSRPLVQLFQNLIGNAIKYRGEQSPQIHISSVRREREWVFSVRDNGIGFEPQYAETIFGVFRRLEGRQYAGTGIGLAICKRIVERYGGHIWAESVRGAGSTFHFTIPAS